MGGTLASYAMWKAAEDVSGMRLPLVGSSHRDWLQAMRQPGPLAVTLTAAGPP